MRAMLLLPAFMAEVICVLCQVSANNMHSVIHATHTRDCVKTFPSLRGMPLSGLSPTQVHFREWIREKIKKSQMTPTAFYRKAGLDGATASRHLADDSLTEIKPSTMERLARAHHYPSPIGGDTAPNGQATHEGADELTPFRGEAPESDIKVLEDGQERWIVHGRSLMGAGYLPGDVVTTDLRISPEDGDAVYAIIGNRACLRRFREPHFVVTVSGNADKDDRPRDVDFENVKVYATIVHMERKRPAD